MHSKIMILIWERWRRTHWAVIAACLLPLIGWLRYVVGDNTLDNVATAIGPYQYMGFTLLIVVLLVGQCEVRNLDLAFPKRLYRFPVRNTTLLVVYMGYGVAAVALPSLILFGFKELFFEQIGVGWTALLVLETVYIVLQTLSWLGGLRAYFLCLAPSLAFLFVYLYLAPLLGLPMGVNAICSIIILLCGAICFWNLPAHRHGAWINGWGYRTYSGVKTVKHSFGSPKSDRQWKEAFLGIFRKRPTKDFASALHAQIWFEFRQTGHLFPLIALCIIGPLLIIAMFSKPSSPMFNIVPIALLLTIVMAELAGILVFAVHHRDRASGASSFWLRRPMATRTLALARLHALIWSLARVLVILTVFVLALAVRQWAYGTLDTAALSPVKWALGRSTPLEAITMTVLGLYGFAVFYWTMLRLAPVVIIWFFVYIAMYFITLLIGDAAASWVWMALIVLLPVAVLGAFCVARRRELITTSTLVIAACIFPVLVVSLWAFPWSYAVNATPKGPPDLNQFQTILLISLATLPFIPVVATPLLMDRLRHH